MELLWEAHVALGCGGRHLAQLEDGFLRDPPLRHPRDAELFHELWAVLRLASQPVLAAGERFDDALPAVVGNWRGHRNPV